MADYHTSSSDSDAEDLLSVLILLDIAEEEEQCVSRNPIRTSSLRGREYVFELLNGSSTVCFELFRLNKVSFIQLCEELRSRNLLDDSRTVYLEEKVAIFLYIIGHNIRHRVASDRFQHSTETISRHFRKTLKAVCRYGKELIKQGSTELPDQYKQNSKYYPWFESCIGAIDGTHISAWAPAEKLTACRGRKSIVTSNVMCACDFNMMFTFVYTGWEGTANDSRVFLDAISRPENHFPHPVGNQYYLVDSGYPCIAGYLPPFRGGRYHISEYHGRGRGPRTRKELFNYRHSSMRMVIERCFGVLKARFPILKLMPPYPPTRQRLIVVACCAIHNFLRQRTQQDHLFNTWENMDPSYMQPSTSTGASSSGASSSNNIANDQGAAIMSQYREHISNMMWIDHCNTSNDE
ncbi:uncharacterized protein LOC119996910 [Tripterygium wilfordii]|uniref:uncharacterized protein LOC119996910 n=1 Tax=Tripterygium wilfordii TaxID=458696 RepID=UPI0018F80477|nr:uncharacterized protein LOC119996910 [Tripterygium wilfordii]